MRVLDGMSRVVLVVGPGHSIREAARLMNERRVGAAVVMDPDLPGPGSITERDLVQALATVEDPQAAGALLACTRDNQVSQVAVQALQRTLDSGATRVDTADLEALAKLSNVYQFQYAFDARYGATVRTAMKEVDTSPVNQQAQRELARREAGPAGG